MNKNSFQIGFEGNLALKNLISDYGSEVASSLLITSAQDSLALQRHYKSLYDAEKAGEKKSKYGAVISTLEAIDFERIKMTAQAVNATVKLPIILTGNMDSMVSATNTAKELVNLGNQVQLDEGRVATKVFDLATGQPVVEIKKTEEVQQPEKVVEMFQESADNVQQSNVAQVEDPTPQRILPFTRYRVLGNNGKFLLKEFQTLNSMSDLEKHCKSLLKENNEIDVLNAYIDHIEGSENVIDMEFEKFTKLKSNIHSMYSRFNNLVKKDYIDTKNQKKAIPVERITMSELLPQLRALISENKIDEARELGNRQTRIIGLKSDTNPEKVIPHWAAITFNEFFENLLKAAAITPNKSIEKTTNDLAKEIIASNPEIIAEIRENLKNSTKTKAVDIKSIFRKNQAKIKNLSLSVFNEIRKMLISTVDTTQKEFIAKVNNISPEDVEIINDKSTIKLGLPEYNIIQEELYNMVKKGDMVGATNYAEVKLLNIEVPYMSNDNNMQILKYETLDNSKISAMLNYMQQYGWQATVVKTEEMGPIQNAEVIESTINETVNEVESTNQVVFQREELSDKLKKDLETLNKVSEITSITGYLKAKIKNNMISWQDGLNLLMSLKSTTKCQYLSDMSDEQLNDLFNTGINPPVTTNTIESNTNFDNESTNNSLISNNLKKKLIKMLQISEDKAFTQAKKSDALRDKTDEEIKNILNTIKLELVA